MSLTDVWLRMRNSCFHPPLCLSECSSHSRSEPSGKQHPTAAHRLSKELKQMSFLCLSLGGTTGREPSIRRFLAYSWAALTGPGDRAINDGWVYVNTNDTSVSDLLTWPRVLGQRGGLSLRIHTSTSGAAVAHLFHLLNEGEGRNAEGIFRVYCDLTSCVPHLWSAGDYLRQ